MKEAPLPIHQKNAYLLQAFAIPLWWLSMMFIDPVYAAFEFPGISRDALLSFCLPDVILITGGSLWQLRKPGVMTRWLVLGAFAYGTLWCISASLLTGGGYLSSMIMSLGTLFNIQLCLGQSVFRKSASHNKGTHVLHTIVQSITIWTLTLAVFPAIILKSTDQWPPSLSSLNMLVGTCLFLLFSSLGVLSGRVMALKGEGTPLPTRGANNLVVTGPYAYIRNPMAVAGLGQGFSVALFLGSLPVSLYVGIGMLVWHFFVRPEEELYLANEFGEAYLDYQQHVKCWIPRRVPYTTM